MERSCKTQITLKIDPVTDACISLEHASQAYHNYFYWIGRSTDVVNSGNATRDLASRPAGWALFHDNTTITAPWIERKDAYIVEDLHIVVNNIIMAIPHPGVVNAATDPANQIMHSNELNGLGIYHINVRASVPSPVVNVICAMGSTADALTPLVYDRWNNRTRHAWKSIADPLNWLEPLGESGYPPQYSYLYLDGKIAGGVGRAKASRAKAKGEAALAKTLNMDASKIIRTE